MSKPKPRALSHAQKYALASGIVAEYYRIMKFDGYDIEIKILDAPCRDHEDGEFCLAHCLPNEPYRTFTLEILPRFFERGEWQQRWSIAHELAHKITAPLKDLAHDMFSGKLVAWFEVQRANERQVDWIAAILCAGKGDGRARG